MAHSSHPDHEQQERLGQYRSARAVVARSLYSARSSLPLATSGAAPPHQSKKMQHNLLRFTTGSFRAMILGVHEPRRSEPRSHPARKLPRVLAKVLERSPVFFRDHPQTIASSGQQSLATNHGPPSRSTYPSLPLARTCAFLKSEQ